jgi:molybdopterin-binding protein
MNPYFVVPEAVYTILVVSVVAIALRSFVIAGLVAGLVITLFVYTRGPGKLRLENQDSGALIAPCDGTITDVYCDTKHQTFVSIEQNALQRHGFYAMLDANVNEIKQNGTHTMIKFDSYAGPIVASILTTSIPAKLLTHEGDLVRKGDLIAFISSTAAIELTLPMYEADIQIQKRMEITAGNMIGHIQQVWV